MRARLFFRDGKITAVYQDGLQHVFGKDNVHSMDRMSEVEWDHGAQRWVAKVTRGLLTGRVLAIADERSACIAQEHAKLEQLMRRYLQW